MRKKLYLKLIEWLTSSGIVKHVDLWNENVQYIEEEQPWECPAVFVEFLPIQWQSLPHGVQEATINFRLHIITRVVEPTSAENIILPAEGEPAADNQYLNGGLEYLDLLEQINALIHCQNSPALGINTITRIQSVTNHNHEEMLESIEDYSVHVVDDSAYNGGETTTITITTT